MNFSTPESHFSFVVAFLFALGIFPIAVRGDSSSYRRPPGPLSRDEVPGEAVQSGSEPDRPGLVCMA